MTDNGLTMDVENIVALVSKNPSISDLHLSGDECVAYRINGEIIKQTEAGKITNESMEVILKQLFNGNPQRFEKFLSDKECDFAYVSKNGISYRVNAFLKTGKIGIVMRKINSQARNLNDIVFTNIADNIRKNVLGAKKGLYLVTGPTGSGKSTTVVAMLEEINNFRNDNLITIEDPIEFIFEPKKCLISQREVGHDTRSFRNSLIGSMRQDPNIIFVGEIRDTETAESVLNLAETGHLVFSTLHTSSAPHTISRFVSFFPTDIQNSIRERLADILLGVQSQILVKTKSGNNRVAVWEVMFNNTAIKNNIKKLDIDQLNNIIESSYSLGMIKQQQYAERLIEKGIIDRDSVEQLFKDLNSKI